MNWCVYGEFSGFKFLLNHDCKKRGSCDFGACDYDYRKLKGAADPILMKSLRRGMLLKGIDFGPGGGMTSAAHTRDDIEQTMAAFNQTISWMKEDGLIK